MTAKEQANQIHDRIISSYSTHSACDEEVALIERYIAEAEHDAEMRGAEAMRKAAADSLRPWVLHGPHERILKLSPDSAAWLAEHDQQVRRDELIWATGASSLSTEDAEIFRKRLAALEHPPEVKP